MPSKTVIGVIVAIVIILVVIIYFVLSSSSSSTPSPTTNPNLVAYYPFDSDASDKSGNGYNGTLMGSPTFVSGKVGNAISLNGKSQFVQLPAEILSSIKNQFTISCWVNLNTVGTWGRIFDFGYGDALRYIFLSCNSVFGIATNGNAATDQITASTLITPSTWHQIVIVLSNSTLTMYLDGVSVGSTPTSATFPLSDAPTNFIGKSEFVADPYLNGLIDEFKIYNVAMNPSQV